MTHAASPWFARHANDRLNGEVDAVARLLHVEPEAIDGAFGVLPIDPKGRRFTIFLDAARVAQVLRAATVPVEGPFSDPTIAPFGPVKE